MYSTIVALHQATVLLKTSAYHSTNLSVFVQSKFIIFCFKVIKFLTKIVLKSDHLLTFLNSGFSTEGDMDRVLLVGPIAPATYF